MKSLGFLERVPKPWRFLAPMVSNCEEAYRRLARQYGADLCYTEMVNSKVFVSSGKKRRIGVAKDERPIVVQICGDDPEVMLEAALSLQEECDAIDINFGCPQEIARRGHYGSFLQEDWDLVGRIVTVLSSKLEVPLFCKIRVFESIEKTVEYSRMIEQSGCSLLAVHGRTREQRGQNTGLASWDHIRAVKQALKIPVIANGNMIYHENIAECISYTKCDGVMIAEPHLYNPAIFSGRPVRSIDIFSEYLSIIRKYPGSAENKHMKSHSFKILKKLLSSRQELLRLLNDCSKLEDYECFVEHLRTLDITDLEYELGPYIRRST